MDSDECSAPCGGLQADAECDAPSCVAGTQGGSSSEPGPPSAPAPADILQPPATPQRRAEDAPCGECVTCAVCLSPVGPPSCSSPAAGETAGRLALVTLCQHTFHRECLVRCRVQRMQAGQLLPCPLCRATLPPGLTPSPRRRLVAGRLDTQPSRGDLVQRCRLAREAVSARWLSRQAAEVHAAPRSLMLERPH